MASSCLHDGEDIYALADTHPKGHLLTTRPFDFYPETEWRDDMGWAPPSWPRAAALRGPRPAAVYYLGEAADWAGAYIAATRRRKR